MGADRGVGCGRDYGDDSWGVEVGSSRRERMFGIHFVWVCSGVGYAKPANIRTAVYAGKHNCVELNKCPDLVQIIQCDYYWWRALLTSPCYGAHVWQTRRVCLFIFGRAPHVQHISMNSLHAFPCTIF